MNQVTLRLHGLDPHLLTFDDTDSYLGVDGDFAPRFDPGIDALCLLILSQALNEDSRAVLKKPSFVAGRLRDATRKKTRWLREIFGDVDPCGESLLPLGSDKTPKVSFTEDVEVFVEIRAKPTSRTRPATKVEIGASYAQIISKYADRWVDLYVEIIPLLEMGSRNFRGRRDDGGVRENDNLIIHLETNHLANFQIFWLSGDGRAFTIYPSITEGLGIPDSVPKKTSKGFCAAIPEDPNQFPLRVDTADGWECCLLLSNRVALASTELILKLLISSADQLGHSSESQPFGFAKNLTTLEEAPAGRARNRLAAGIPANQWVSELFSDLKDHADYAQVLMIPNKTKTR